MKNDFYTELKKLSVAGFQQYYFIVAESTVKHFCGRWFYKDGDFYEAEVFSLNSYPDSGMIFKKKVNVERMDKAINDGYVSLWRVPKQSYKSIYPEQLIY